MNLDDETCSCFYARKAARLLNLEHVLVEKCNSQSNGEEEKKANLQ